MVLLPIGGIEVDFPYEPYGVQKQYMARVISALRSGCNACLESPTGTGKSLALLCATLAWREAYVAALQLRANGGCDEKLFKSVGLSATPEAPVCEDQGNRDACRSNEQDLSHPVSGEVEEPVAQKTGGENGSSVLQALLSAVKPGAAPVELRAPRIVFSSRTHSQLAQAIGELKTTIYRPYMTVLGSRDQLCIHDIARKHSGPRLNGACRSLTAPTRRGCRYHLSVMSPRDHENRSKSLLQQLKDEPAKDIEDLGEFGIREGACPYFLTRSAVSSGEIEILFLPYNYLIHKATRDSLDVDWANDVVIIDEAHNLESICSDALSFDLTPAVRQGCQRELLQCITKAANPSGLEFPALEKLAATEAGAELVAGTELVDVHEFRDLLKLLKQFDAAIDTLPLSQSSGGVGNGGGSPLFVARPASFMRELLGDMGCSGEAGDTRFDSLERAVEAWNDSGESDANPGHSDNTGSRATSSALRILHNALRILFDPSTSKYESCFQTVVQPANPEVPAAGRIVSYWCFNPAVAMSEISALRLRSLIVTSGTLSPIDSFASELGVPFPVRLENRHVIGPDQVRGAVICTGPDGSRLSSNFKVRETDAYKVSLGRTILQMAKVVPDGILVFFPSYRAMNSCMEFWRAVGVGAHGQRPSISELIQQYKHIIMEPRESANFNAAILSHQNKIRDGTQGSILFAVCRGKVSEGIDFSDAYGRAVIMAGIPYPAAFDPKVTLKKRYMDWRISEQQKKAHVPCDEATRSSKDGTLRYTGGTSQDVCDPCISGEDWYTLQALRAVNQAVGRAIRHKDDYGIILMCDERFSSAHLQLQLSRWLRPYISVYKSSDAASDAASKFFSRAKVAPFALRSSLKEQRRRERLTDKADGDNMSWGHRKRGLQGDDIDAQITEARETIAKFLPPQRTDEDLQRDILRITGGLEFDKGPASSKSQQVHAPHGNLLDLLGARPHDADTSPGGNALLGPEKDELVPQGTKMSAQFVEGQRLRAKAQLPPKLQTERRRMLSSSSTQPLAAQAKRQKLSDTARALFDNQEHFRSAFSCLRRLLSLAKEVVDGEGPLQTSSQRERALNQGNEEVGNLVRCIRFKCGAQVSGAEVVSFLGILRPKIPTQFLTAYDTVVAETRGIK